MTSFDLTPQGYDSALQRGLAVTGESRDFYARERVIWTARRLGERGCRPASVLDFGCGTGATTRLLRDLLNAATVVGTDPSATLLAAARAAYGGGGVSFEELPHVPDGRFDLVYVNGVFHHIEPADRDQALAHVLDRLVPGGYLALWENSPFNPGTRYVMSRIPFDRDARMLRPSESRARMRRAGFEVVSTDYRFVFPRPLSFLRPLEPSLARLPLGGQYLVLGRRPGA